MLLSEMLDPHLITMASKNPEFKYDPILLDSSYIVSMVNNEDFDKLTTLLNFYKIQFHCNLLSLHQPFDLKTKLTDIFSSNFLATLKCNPLSYQIFSVSVCNPWYSKVIEHVVLHSSGAMVKLLLNKFFHNGTPEVVINYLTATKHYNFNYDDIRAKCHILSCQCRTCF